MNRKDLLKTLSQTFPGLSRKEVLEQSDCFIFEEGKITTFNGEILATCGSPLDFKAAVPAQDFIKLLNKIPDDEINILRNEGELVIRGKSKKAGLKCYAESFLPTDSIPVPEKWFILPDDVMKMLAQAARTCGPNINQYLTTTVHATNKMIEGCDGKRLFQVEMKTGFPKETLIPATSVLAIYNIGLNRIAITDGWCHFKKDDLQISVRCSHETYLETDKLTNIGESRTVVFPPNIKDILSRAEIMSEASVEEASIKISLNKGAIEIKSEKSTGWYKERKKIDYTGEEFSFFVNPKFMVDLLDKTGEAQITDSVMKMQFEGMTFMVALQIRATEESSTEETEGTPF